MLLPFDTITRSLFFDDRANEIQLRPWQWEFLLAADGETRVGALALACGIDFETASDLVRETEAMGLIDIVTLSLDKYREGIARRVLPVAETPGAVSEPVFAAASTATPVTAVPRKTVSLSFDSFSSIVADWEPMAVAMVPAESTVVEPTIHEPEFDARHEEHVDRAMDETLAHDVSLDAMALDFEFPNHMEPLGARNVTFLESRTADSFEDSIAAPIYDEFAHNGAASTNSDPSPEPSFSHEYSYHEYAHEAGAQAIDERETVTSFAPEPTVAPKKSVSFTLTADSFGLPKEPFDAPSFDAHAESAFALETPEHEADAFALESPSIKKDDVLLQHFQVDGSQPSAGHSEPSGIANEPDTRTNSDLTGVVLRVLGLKK